MPGETSGTNQVVRLPDVDSSDAVDRALANEDCLQIARADGVREALEAYGRDPSEDTSVAVIKALVRALATDPQFAVQSNG
ncbi:hypothetical protein KIP75_29800 [Pseudomonas aeruginosa]|uniref:hypothetical protein n=1 Tax=Pseudomonas aeruginosa TaxID=287 RepID=UPI001BFF62EF|nr:hypothetical protein [Pseudomonas aeruginosa]MBT9112211.1 hypothetical protein [Pseudomonas aeruginosa]MBT9117952.1 hypothetical protein [Pseudomonas aeruginosa]MBT9123775.1 hypothetical protein [Pseudomonas aeruginosa]